MHARAHDMIGIALISSLVIGLGGAGCGDDDDDGEINQDAGAGAGGASGAGGTSGAGAGGASGAGGIGGDAGDDAGVDEDAGAIGDGANGLDGSLRLVDEQIVGVMAAVNTSEIEQAALAMDRASNADVRAYATKMWQEHTQANERLTDLIADQEIESATSSVRQQFATESLQVIQTLQNQTGSAFELTYMQAQRTAHARVLALIDATLLPSVDNAALEMELLAMRADIVDHLAGADALVEELTQ